MNLALGASRARVCGQNHEMASRAEGQAGRGPVRGVVDESHPSWVAKRQQKALLRLKPRGRRTVFRDEESKEVIAVGTLCQVPDSSPFVREGSKERMCGSSRDASTGRATIDGDRNQGRGKSWGDADRGAVASLVLDCPATVCRSVGKKAMASDASVEHVRMMPQQADATLEGMHPSWAAAKRRKIELAKLQAMSAAFPAGKKITFND